MLSIIIVAAIAVAIYLGYKTKINTGLFCIVFAYMIGCFGMGLKTKELIGFWPTSTMFGFLYQSASSPSGLYSACWNPLFFRLFSPVRNHIGYFGSGLPQF